jgi:hypothetical protein
MLIWKQKIMIDCKFEILSCIKLCWYENKILSILRDTQANKWQKYQNDLMYSNQPKTTFSLYPGMSFCINSKYFGFEA